MFCLIRCTLDAVGQLASAIDKKHLQTEEGAPVIKPILIVQCDQFGIAHAPFAQGRSFLTERGFGDCKVLIHQRRHGKKSGDVESDDSHADLRLVEVTARYVWLVIIPLQKVLASKLTLDSLHSHAVN